MSVEKIYRICGGLCIFCGVLALTVNKFIFAFILLCVGIGVFLTGNRGKSFNESNLYDKRVAAKGKSLEDLYEFLKDTETPLGICWMGKFKGNEAIIFGPTAYKDVITIVEHGDMFVFKNANVMELIEADEDNQWRMEKVLDTSELAVTPKRYTIFSSLKVMTSVLLDDLAQLVERFANNEARQAPKVMDVYEFFRHDNGEDKLLDVNDNCILNVEVQKKPIEIILRDENGEEMAKLCCRNPNYRDPAREDFDIYSDGELFGTIRHDLRAKTEKYIIETVNGTLTAEAFAIIRKTNISFNFEITKDDERKAVVIGSAKLDFGLEGGWLQNNIVCSFDNDYLVLYTLFELFIITSSTYLR